MTDDDYDVGMRSMLMGQLNVTRIGTEFIRDGGSITLTSGVGGRVPVGGTTSISLVSPAIEGFVRAAALELPRRHPHQCRFPAVADRDARALRHGRDLGRARGARRARLR